VGGAGQAAAEAECWVMAYGFTPEHQPAVVAELQRCGEVVRVQHPSRGNWLALRFHQRHGAGADLSRVRETLLKPLLKTS
jgi:hypothetical protein